MIRNKLKNSNGITLVSLSITVVVILLITNIIIYNVKDNLTLEKLRNMQNDISNLKDKISVYYAQNGEIPAKIKYNNIDKIDVISDAVDTGEFYIIDLKELDNLTLNYGKDYEEIRNINTELTDEQMKIITDIYIINQDSHNIFYVQGIEIDNEIYYTNYAKEDIDKEQIDLRYIDNVKIPEGYLYIEGTKETGIKIRNKENSSEEYIWQVENNKISDIPDNVEFSDEQNEQEFIESVNIYGGYYKNTTNNSVIYLELEEIWTETYDQSGIYKDKNTNIVQVPAGFQVCLTNTKNTVDDGLIIRNATTDDRYVWIEVPKTSSIYKESGLNITEFTEEEYEKIYNDLKTYTSDYKDDNYNDEWYEGCGIETEDDYNSLKNKMLKSVYENGGFWIAQYEMGVGEARTSGDDELKTAVSKKGAYPYNYITCSQAQQLATNLDSGDYTSSLMFGVQWDLVLKHIETKGDKKQAQLKTDSTEWGNYRNSKFEVTEGNYAIYNQTNQTLEEWKEIPANYTKPDTGIENIVLLSTGIVEKNTALNIYDLAGNVYEWTLENMGTEGPSTCRAGNYGGTGQVQSAYFRAGVSIQKLYHHVGFRATLY